MTLQEVQTSCVLLEKHWLQLQDEEIQQDNKVILALTDEQFCMKTAHMVYVMVMRMNTELNSQLQCL